MQNRNSPRQKILKESEALQNDLIQVQNFRKKSPSPDRDKKIQDLTVNIRSHVEDMRVLLEKDPNPEMQNIGSQFYQEYLKCEKKKWTDVDLANFKIVTDVLIIYLKARAA